MKFSKYGNVVSLRNGRSLASKLERSVYDLLCLMEKGGLIRDLQCQKSVSLTDAKIQYIADFTFFDLKKDRQVWAEAKGFETAVWKIKKRLWKHYGPGPLEIWCGNHLKPFLAETVIPK